MLSESSQTQKDTRTIPLLPVSRIAKYLETESRIGVTRGWGEGGMGELVFNDYGYGVSIWDDDKVLERDGGDSCTTL